MVSRHLLLAIDYARVIKLPSSVNSLHFEISKYLMPLLS
jgi:hypothetical protein